MACRRVLSSTPLLVRGSQTGGDSGERKLTNKNYRPITGIALLLPFLLLPLLLLLLLLLIIIILLLPLLLLEVVNPFSEMDCEIIRKLLIETLRHEVEIIREESDKNFC
jgi:hypothetical protein